MVHVYGVTGTILMVSYLLWPYHIKRYLLTLNPWQESLVSSMVMPVATDIRLKDSIGILILLFLIQVSSNQLNSDIFGQFWSCIVIMTSSQNFSKKLIFAASGSQERFLTTKMISLEYWAHTLSNAVSHDHLSSSWCKMVTLTTYNEKWS